MQEREAQESQVEVCSPQDEDPFRLWAATLSHALEETSAIDTSSSSDCQVGGRNGASSNGATTAASLEEKDERQRGDEEAEQESLVATWRRVSLGKERLRLEQAAMRQAVEDLGRLLEQAAMRPAVEDLGRLRTEVQARRMKAAGNGQRGQDAQDEIVFWLQAEKEPTRQAKEEVQGTVEADHRAEEPASKPGEETTQLIQLRSPQSTPQLPIPDNGKTAPSGRTLMMLVPNPQYSEASVSGAKLALVTCKRRIIRYGRHLWGGLT